MSSLELKTQVESDQLISDSQINKRVGIDELIKKSIVLDLIKLNWKIDLESNRIILTAPHSYDKNTIRKSMEHKRNENIKENRIWIEKNLPRARANLIDGFSALNSSINPSIEICTTRSQHALFRILRYYWSSPYSEYVGRRMRILIRDDALPSRPVIGIAALGSSIIHIPDRDDYIGWDTETRTKNIVYAMDAYVLGALPPYNYLLGGKLISYIIASNEIRNYFFWKYSNKKTLIKERFAHDLVAIFTTGLYGKSSQYNRIHYDGQKLYYNIGNTKGFGTLHISDQTIALMVQFLKAKNIIVSNRFGAGPSWRMRVIRTTAELLGFDSDLLLKHAFKRSIYYVPLADNAKEFLKGTEPTPRYRDLPLKSLVEFWKERWLSQRKKNSEIINRISYFDPSQFRI